MRAGGVASESEGTVQVPEDQLAKQNEASMRQLQNMMGGLGT
jgi:hypothetical protein